MTVNAALTARSCVNGKKLLTHALWNSLLTASGSISGRAGDHKTAPVQLAD